MPGDRKTVLVERITPKEYVRRMREVQEQEQIARRRARSSAEARKERELGRKLTQRITAQLVTHLEEGGWFVRKEVYIRRGSGCIQSRRIDVVAEREVSGVKLSCSFEVKVVRDDFLCEKRHPEKSLSADELQIGTTLWHRPRL
jgi:hypothetical protein